MTIDSKPTGNSYEPGYETIAKKIIQFIITSGLQPGDPLPTELNTSSPSSWV